MRKNALALCLLLAASPAAAAFEDLGAGARAPGMGGVFTAVADDVFTLHYNPAGLALLPRPEFGSSYTRLLAGLTDGSDLSTTFLGYVHPIKEGRSGAAGVSWEQFSFNSGLYQEQTLALSYGRTLAQGLGPGDLYGGLSAKYLRRSFGSLPEASNATDGEAATNRADPVLSGRRSVSAPDADLGLLYRWKENYSLGLAVLHAGAPDVAFNPAESDRVPMTVKLGLNYRSLLSNIGAEYETRRSPLGGRDNNLGMAVERWFPKLFVGEFGLRGGFDLGSRSYRQFTVGLSYRTARMAVDYAFVLPLASLAASAGSHRLGFSIRFGSAKAPDESVVMILEAMRKLKAGKAPEFHVQAPGLSPGQKAQLDEYLALALSLQAQARYKAALERMAQALAVSPGDAELLKGFGRLNWVAQQVPELPSHKTDPVEAAWHEGILAHLSGNSAAAVERVSYALSLTPDNKGLDGFLAQLELATGLRRPAIEEAPSKSYEREKRLTRAAAAIEEGRYDEAIALSLEVLKEDPDNLAAWENLGTSYFAIGDSENSLAAWRRAYALEKNPARRDLLDGYLKSLKRLLARPKAEAKAEHAGPAGPKASPLEIQRIYNSGIDLYTSGRLEEARAAFQRVLDLDPAYVPAAKALKRVVEELDSR